MATFTTAITNTSDTQIDWKLSGAGTLTPGGSSDGWAVYGPPEVMPSNRTVTVTAFLAANHSVTSTYTITLVNPVPSVTSVTPTQLLSGGTQTVSLAGTDFVPGMTVVFNGATLPVAYDTFHNVSVQVPVPGNASGKLTLQTRNPTPGGGAGSTFAESVVPNSITLTANDNEGTNTGTADLGYNVDMSAHVAGSMQTTVNWSISGAGSISSSGVYTPPTAMPANRAVTIKAALASNTALTATYKLNIVNAAPIVSSGNPVEIPAGSTTSVTLTGVGFVPATVIEANGKAVKTTYKSPTVVVASVAVPENETGSITLKGENPTPGGGLGPEFEQAISAPISQIGAARLLDQTTFGPTTSLINHVEGEGVTAWLAEQYYAPQTVLATVPTKLPGYCPTAEFCLDSEWWRVALTGNDQLRQRVAFALSEIFVVSSEDVDGQGINYYMNTLAKDAFANWYTIMNDVTLSPAMGIYLNLLNSRKPTSTLIANENFARENMQLFNLGLDLLNQDGSLKLNASGNPIPTYTEAQVQAFARAYTGWTFSNPNGSKPSGLTIAEYDYHPLVAIENEHDENSKTLLNGTTLPAGQSAEQDLSGALTNVFNHPNLPPFVCKQLIQHLVKSNPSPNYVSRVAAVFINDGNDVRGNMQAVLTAIFTDPEARDGDTSAQASDGHLREPILWLTGVMRGLGYVNIDPNDYYHYLSDRTQPLGEIPFTSPSVFNFFSPGYVIPDTKLSGPEFALENTASVTDRLTLADQLVNNENPGFNVDLSATSPFGKILVSKGPAALVDALSGLFLYHTMDLDTEGAITGEISSIKNDISLQVKLATYLTITSSQYKILH